MVSVWDEMAEKKSVDLYSTALMPRNGGRGRAVMGNPSFKYVLKDSPDYRPPCGNEYTERQLRILNGEIALSEIRANELANLKSKALRFSDTESYEIADALYEEKLCPAEHHFRDSWTAEYAEWVLQNLTPMGQKLFDKPKVKRGEPCTLCTQSSLLLL